MRHHFPKNRPKLKLTTTKSNQQPQRKDRYHHTNKAGAGSSKEARSYNNIIKLWEVNARYRVATEKNSDTSNMSSYGGGGYNNGNRGGGGGGHNNNNTYAERSAASRTAAPPAAKKHMLKLVILGDSG